MSTHNICFCQEKRQLSMLFGFKKRLILSYVGLLDRDSLKCQILFSAKNKRKYFKMS